MVDSPVLREKDTPNLLVAITTYLEAQGVGTRGEDLWEQQMPESPTLATVVVLTGGPILPEDPTRRISFQIQHRSKQAAAGLRKSKEINNLLDNQWNVLVGFPGRITAVSEAGASFKDDSGNLVFPLNYSVISTHQG